MRLHVGHLCVFALCSAIHFFLFTALPLLLAAVAVTKLAAPVIESTATPILGGRQVSFACTSCDAGELR